MAVQTVPDVGAGTTIAFTTSDITLRVTSIQVGKSTVTVHDVTHLGSTVRASGDLNTREKLAGQHVMLDGLNIQFHWDWDAYTALGVSQTITITDPDGNTLSGTGILSEVDGPEYTDDGLLVGSGKIDPSGQWAKPAAT